MSHTPFPQGSQGEREREKSGVFPYKNIYPIGSPLWPHLSLITSLEAPSPHLGVRASTYLRKTQTFSHNNILALALLLPCHSLHFRLGHSHCYCWRQSSWIIQQLLYLGWQGMAVLIRSCSVIQSSLSKFSTNHIVASISKSKPSVPSASLGTSNLSEWGQVGSDFYSAVLATGEWKISQVIVPPPTRRSHPHSPKRSRILMVSISWGEKALRK